MAKLAFYLFICFDDDSCGINTAGGFMSSRIVSPRVATDTTPPTVHPMLDTIPTAIRLIVILK